MKKLKGIWEVAALTLLFLLPSFVTADTATSLRDGSKLPLSGGTIVANLGAELAPAIGAGTGWTCGAGWDCSVAGTLNKNADGVGTAVPNPAITAVVGTTYKVVITVGAVSVGNGATYTLGGTSGPVALTAAATYTHYVTAATTASLIVTPTPTGTRFTITNVSVKPLTDATGDLEVQGDLVVDSSATVYGSQVLVGNGTAALPAYSFIGCRTCGFRLSSGVPIFEAPSGVNFNSNLTANNLIVGDGYSLKWTSYGILTSPATATLQLGAANAAAPVAQTLQPQGSRPGTDVDVAGGNLTITRWGLERRTRRR
jgi:hypothetical protein